MASCGRANKDCSSEEANVKEVGCCYSTAKPLWEEFPVDIWVYKVSDFDTEVFAQFVPKLLPQVY